MSPPSPQAQAQAAADAASKEKAAERRRLFRNQRDVLYGEVLVNLGIGAKEEVFPNGAPPLQHASFAATPSLAAVSAHEKGLGDELLGMLQGAWHGVRSGLNSVPLPSLRQGAAAVPAAGSAGGAAASGQLQSTVSMKDVKPPPFVDFDKMSEETIRSTKQVMDPLDGIIKRIRSLTNYRASTFTVHDIPCTEERNKVYRCYHEAHAAALARRKREFVDADPQGLWRPTEVLACDELATDFLRCAGFARQAYVDKLAREGWVFFKGAAARGGRRSLPPLMHTKVENPACNRLQSAMSRYSEAYDAKILKRRYRPKSSTRSKSAQDAEARGLWSVQPDEKRGCSVTPMYPDVGAAGAHTPQPEHPAAAARSPHSYESTRYGFGGRPRTPNSRPLQLQPSPTYLVYDPSLHPPNTTTPKKGRFAQRTLARDRERGSGQRSATPNAGIGGDAPEYRAVAGHTPSDGGGGVLPPDVPTAASYYTRHTPTEANFSRGYSPVPSVAQCLDPRSPSPPPLLPQSTAADAPSPAWHNAWPRSISPGHAHAPAAHSPRSPAHARFERGDVRELYRTVSEPARFRKMFEKCLTDLQEEQGVLAKVRRFLHEILTLKQGGGKGGLGGVRHVIQCRRAKREVNTAGRPRRNGASVSPRRAGSSPVDPVLEADSEALTGSLATAHAAAHVSSVATDAVDSALRQMEADIVSTVEAVDHMLQQVLSVEDTLATGRQTLTAAIDNLQHVVLRPPGEAEEDEANPFLQPWGLQSVGVGAMAVTPPPRGGTATPTRSGAGALLTPRSPRGEDPFKSLSEVESAMLKSVTLRKECRRRIGLVDANNRRLLDKVEKALEQSIAQEERQHTDTKARIRSLQDENARLATQLQLLQSSMQERVKEREIVAKRLKLRQQRPLLGEDHDKVCDALAGEMESLSSALDHFRNKHANLQADIEKLKGVCHQLSADAAAMARLLEFDRSVLAQPW